MNDSSMNGEINGTMEAAMETPSSPINREEAKTPIIDLAAANNHCDENNSNKALSIHSENSNHLEEHLVSELSNEPTENSNLKFPTQNYDTQVDKDRDVNEISNDGPDNNHSSITSSSGSSSSSSENYTMSMDTSLQKLFPMPSLDLPMPPPLRTDDGSVEDEDSDDDSSDDEGSVGSEEPRAEDTVSVNSDSELEGSDDDSTPDCHRRKTKNNDLVILDNLGRNVNRNGDHANRTQSTEVHEIDSDNDDGEDCVVMNEDNAKSRAVKRKTYHDSIENGDDEDDEESDIEEISIQDPLNQLRNKPIVVNDTKALVEMASKQLKEKGQSNEPTVVIIDTNSLISGKSSIGSVKSSVSSTLSAQSLYQSIAARGTTVTPVTSKHTASTQIQTPQPVILPSLTDDMYVVEAPSFIVPYVYEKPSVKPFREFVDVLGRELEIERTKVEAKEKEEKEKRDRERRERGEIVEDSEEEDEKEELKPTPVDPEAEAKKKKEEKKKRKRAGLNDDDASWDGESSSESEDEAISDDDQGTTVVIKEKDDNSIEDLKKNITATSLTESKIPGLKTDSYFDNALGKFFLNIGVSLVQEYVQADLLKQQKRKLHKEIKTGGTNTKPTESAIVSLSKNLEFSKENNAPFAFLQKKCKFCSFKTESMLAMAHHLETPHMKNNVYNCNFCKFEIRSPHDILYHMEEEHNTRGRLERAPAYHQCANCPFEDNGKGKLARHLIPCAKKYKPELNLCPPVDWEPPAKIPKMIRARNAMLGSYQPVFNRAPTPGLPRSPISMAGIMPGVQNTYRPRGRTPMGMSPRGAAVHGTPLIRGGVVVRHNAPIMVGNNYTMMQNAGKSAVSPKMLHQPSISITPLPRAPQPAAATPGPAGAAPQPKGTFVICEICDGYIKDLEQLRNHMQWIHKVKIHPKMIYNRPPLNCQKCQFRFFTDQGLERHLLGSHGLVTSSMQEAANKGKDAGRCPACGRVYQWKLLNHVARDHNMTLKPAHLSYKCTVCTATFGMYKQFENHVYSAHSVVAKRVMDKNKTAPAANTKISAPSTKSDALSKPLKINDEITIIPQGAKASAAVPSKANKD